ncbi:MAG TPA: hypothetical protein VEQ61_09270 [Thermoleophilaceae bacterium]|nr:hypothetical protein [Thermoleophilaceae bacterium]
MHQMVDKTGETRLPATDGAWEPIQLTYIGSVGELMRATPTGSKRDASQGCGSSRRRTSPTGTPC